MTVIKIVKVVTPTSENNDKKSKGNTKRIHSDNKENGKEDNENEGHSHDKDTNKTTITPFFIGISKRPSFKFKTLKSVKGQLNLAILPQYFLQVSQTL